MRRVSVFTTALLAVCMLLTGYGIFAQAEDYYPNGYMAWYNFDEDVDAYYAYIQSMDSYYVRMFNDAGIMCGDGDGADVAFGCYMNAWISSSGTIPGSHDFYAELLSFSCGIEQVDGATLSLTDSELYAWIDESDGDIIYDEFYIINIDYNNGVWEDYCVRMFHEDGGSDMIYGYLYDASYLDGEQSGAYDDGYYSDSTYEDDSGYDDGYYSDDGTYEDDSGYDDDVSGSASQSGSRFRVLVGIGEANSYITSVYHRPVDDDYYIYPNWYSTGDRLWVYEATDEFYYVEDFNGYMSGFVKQEEVDIVDLKRPVITVLPILEILQVVSNGSPVPAYFEDVSGTQTVTYLEEGAQVFARYYEDDRVLCSFEFERGEMLGWIDPENLALNHEPDADYINGNIVLGWMEVTNCYEGAALRSDPDRDAMEYVLIPRGEQVAAHYFYNDWVFCSYGSTTGWMQLEYLYWN